MPKTKVRHKTRHAFSPTFPNPTIIRTFKHHPLSPLKEQEEPTQSIKECCEFIWHHYVRDIQTNGWEEPLYITLWSHYIAITLQCDFPLTLAFVTFILSHQQWLYTTACKPFQRHRQYTRGCVCVCVCFCETQGKKLWLFEMEFRNKKRADHEKSWKKNKKKPKRFIFMVRFCNPYVRLCGWINEWVSQWDKEEWKL